MERGETYMNVTTQIPIEFGETYALDDRFMQVKIWILNIGKNYNGSVFTKEAVLKALPTIYNTPILGYVEENAMGEKDFSDHRMELVVQDGDFKTRYLGSAYGVIGENCNPQFEMRENELGGLEEYLTVTGLLWSKFDDVMDIMNRDTKKYQSMELSTSYDGYFDQEGYFVFTNFKFFGACILGAGTEPAIPRSTIERMFSIDKVAQDVASKLSEYKIKFAKEDVQVTVEAIMKEFNFSKEYLTSKGIVFEDRKDIEAFKEELKRLKESEQQKADNQDQSGGKQDEPKDAKKDEKDFGKGNGNFDKQQEDQTDDPNDQKDDKKDVVNQDLDNHNKDDDNNPSDDDEKSAEDLANELKDLEEEYARIKKERDLLKQYKAKREKDDHKAQAEALFAMFDKLEESDYAEIKENLYDYSIQEIEDKLFALLGRKTASNVSPSKKKSEFAKFSFSDKLEKEKEKRESKSYEHYFQKHLKKD